MKQQKIKSIKTFLLESIGNPVSMRDTHRPYNRDEDIRNRKASLQSRHDELKKKNTLKELGKQTTDFIKKNKNTFEQINNALSKYGFSVCITIAPKAFFDGDAFDMPLHPKDEEPIYAHSVNDIKDCLYYNVSDSETIEIGDGWFSRFNTDLSNEVKYNDLSHAVEYNSLFVGLLIVPKSIDRTPVDEKLAKKLVDIVNRVFSNFSDEIVIDFDWKGSYYKHIYANDDIYFNYGPGEAQDMRPGIGFLARENNIWIPALFDIFDTYRFFKYLEWEYGDDELVDDKKEEYADAPNGMYVYTDHSTLLRRLANAVKNF